jgi:nitronate monooxygenase
VFAAEVLGCDLSYMGTKFIATEESMAVDEYKQMLVTSELDDVLLSRAFTGLETNTLVPSIVAAGLDPKDLPSDMTKERADALYGRQATSGVKRWRDVWSAGHSVSGVAAIEAVATLVARTRDEYETARAATRRSPAWVAR